MCLLVVNHFSLTSFARPCSIVMIQISESQPGPQKPADSNVMLPEKYSDIFLV